ncbi:MAG TPA: DUF4932 domain-containing protein [Pyrinomonadaceae bacterium]|nr:DUF4932 domain-containing protein [Pyrinomonadaceae bacterium]
MRIFLCGIFLFLSFVQINAQTSKTAQPLSVMAKVDQRVELLSIVARLAEYDEYVNNDFKIYAADVDKYFAKYKQHPAIEFARKIRESNGVGFDAVASMAVHLNPNLTPKITFSEGTPDKRWTKKGAEEFVKLLQQFYKDANCETFFKSHAELYKTAEERFQTLLNKVDFAWYKAFYGEIPKGSFNLYIGLLNGGGNFGPKVVFPDGREESFAIIGTWKMDEKGLPIYTDDVLPTIIHEYNHSFINHLVYANEQVLSAAGEKVFKPVEDKMAAQAYTSWKTMMLESLVRAAVVRYLFDHDKSAYLQEITVQQNRYFLWIDELSVLLGTYENSRKTYPTFRSFMPMVTAYYTDLAKRIGDKVESFAKKQPKVIAIDAFTNGAQDVDSKITQITFTFDRGLSGKGYSINLGKSGEEHFPIEKVIGYSENDTKVTVQVKLKPDWDYEFVLTGNAFKSKDGYALQNYSVKFKTKKQ